MVNLSQAEAPLEQRHHGLNMAMGPFITPFAILKLKVKMF